MVWLLVMWMPNTATCKRRGDYGVARAHPVPYITSSGDWDTAPGCIREKVQPNGNEKQGQEEVMNALAKKVYSRMHGVLDGCGFCKSKFSFQECVKSLHSSFDLRGFLGGMSNYHNSKLLLQSLDFPHAALFPDNFVDPSSTHIDQALVVARLSSDVYGLSLNIWNALLWFALMKRPRRDPGIVNEFAHSLTTLSMKMLPKSIFPYTLVPMTRLDPFTGFQVMMDLRDASDETVR
jgi:hypothetical protein